jgi:hypothetical protein
MQYLILIIGLILLLSGTTGRILPKTLPFKIANTGEPTVFINPMFYAFVGLVFTLNALFLILAVHKR